MPKEKSVLLPTLLYGVPNLTQTVKSCDFPKEGHVPVKGITMTVLPKKCKVSFILEKRRSLR